jgi:hypothetical protein
MGDRPGGDQVVTLGGLAECIAIYGWEKVYGSIP